MFAALHACPTNAPWLTGWVWDKQLEPIRGRLAPGSRTVAILHISQESLEKAMLPLNHALDPNRPLQRLAPV